jgi:(p)ppGpp synthase/HD superfamily hydrolase
MWRLAMTTLTKAIQMADHWHRGQTRKYNGEPYIEHPMRVMTRVVRDSEIPGHSTVNGMAAALHDVVEDCDVTVSTICDEFGHDVGLIVRELTNEYTPQKYPMLNRAARKAKEACRLAMCCCEVRAIKLIDRIDNLKCCNSTPIKAMGDFAAVYAKESYDLAIALGSFFPRLSGELVGQAVKLRDAAGPVSRLAERSEDPCYGCWKSQSSCHNCPNGGLR